MRYFRTRTRSTRFLLVGAAVAVGLFAVTAGSAGAQQPGVTFVPPSPPATVTQDAASYDAIAFIGSANGDVTGSIQTISGGCDTSAFSGFLPGNVALIPEGGIGGLCPFGVRVQNAEDAGASAVIISYRSDTIFQGLLVDRFGNALTATIPAVLVSHSSGAALVSSGSPVRVTIPSGNLVALTYTVNRGTKQVASISCTLDSVATSCGNQLSSGKTSIGYVELFRLATGSHTFTVTVRFTDHGALTASYTLVE
jgi:hypothetical protein